MGSKASAPAAPNYQPVAQASVDAANIQAQTSRDQLDWAKQQYATQAPITNAYVQSQIDQSNQQQKIAGQAQDRYTSIYQPVEDQFVKTATDWNSPQRSDQQAGAAIADVSSAMNASRNNALSNLESYGIDPSQTRYGALDLGMRVQEAAGQAAAGTQSRQNTEATGLALQGEAINIGKGYPGQVAQSYAGATSAGQAGISSALNTMSTGSSMMGSPTQWAGAANQSAGQATSALNTGFNNQLAGQQLKAQQNQAAQSQIGSLIGAAGMAAVLM